MNSIVPRETVEYSNQRILTTQQIAKAYGTTTQIVINNFNRNKKRFTEGKHYYALEGETKMDFLNQNQIDFGSRASSFYLWTEKGALLLAKILNTDEAWTASETLIDEYYRDIQIVVTLKAENKRLQTLADIALQGLVDAARVPHTPPERGIDHIENWEIESTLRNLNEHIQLLRKPDKRDVALDRIDAKLNKLGAMINHEEEMLYQLDEKFLQQEQTLKTLSEQLLPPPPDEPKLLS